jgi:predicted transcriptional regulator
MMKKTKIKKVKFGELEDKVMQCIWDLCDSNNGKLVDVKTIIETLNGKNPERQYVYTTIHTTCLRLCKKKRLEKVQIKNKYFYKTFETKNNAFKQELEALADKYFNGNKQAFIDTIKSLQE